MSGDRSKPSAPIYVVSKGRADSRLTIRALEYMGVSYRVVVEAAERDAYAAVVDPKFGEVLVLDPRCQAEYETCDDLGSKKSKGPGPARNFAWEHALASGARWHWVMDDNIRRFYRFNRNLKVPADSGAIFRAMEDFSDRYENVLMSGPNYFMFCSRKSRQPPFVANTRIYSCVSPETQILCADLTWRQAGLLLPGQRIVAFDSEARSGGRGCNAREYRTAVVERNALLKKASFVVSTDVGVPVQASDDHPWLVLRSEPLRRHRKGREAETHRDRGTLSWVVTRGLRIGDRIAHLARPWVRDETHDGGWVSGIYDGEGCCTVRRDTHGIQLAIAQKPGVVFDRLKALLYERGYEFGVTSHKSGVDCLRLGGGFRGAIRFAGEFAPSRLISKAPELWEGRGVRLGQSYEWATVTAIKDVGVRVVAQITTSTGTFVTGGYLTHNCNLIRCDAPFRWRGRYNEDTDLSLRILKSGACTVQFNAFLQEKTTTQVLAGGNTAEFYASEGTGPKSAMLARMHPDVARIVRRFGRVHHFVDYGPFRKNKLVRREGVEVSDAPDDYGMVLREGLDGTYSAPRRNGAGS